MKRFWSRNLERCFAQWLTLSSSLLVSQNSFVWVVNLNNFWIYQSTRKASCFWHWSNSVMESKRLTIKLLHWWDVQKLQREIKSLVESSWCSGWRFFMHENIRSSKFEFETRTHFLKCAHCIYLLQEYVQDSHARFDMIDPPSYDHFEKEWWSLRCFVIWKNCLYCVCYSEIFINDNLKQTNLILNKYWFFWDYWNIFG